MEFKDSRFFLVGVCSLLFLIGYFSGMVLETQLMREVGFIGLVILYLSLPVMSYLSIEREFVTQTVLSVVFLAILLLMNGSPNSVFRLGGAISLLAMSILHVVILNERRSYYVFRKI